MIRAAVYAVLSWAIARIVGARHTREPLDDVRREIERGGAVLVDVREPSEWDAGHLRDAVPLPLSRLRAGVPTDELARILPPGRPAYLYCGAGGRSLIAASSLNRLGYDARALKPGFGELARAGFSIAVGPEAAA